MKTLSDYGDPYWKESGYYSVHMVADSWPLILMNEVKDVGMDNNEFLQFTRFFLTQLPHDWDGSSYMGVKIHRIK